MLDAGLTVLLKDVNPKNQYLRLLLLNKPYPVTGIKNILLLVKQEVVHLRPFEVGRTDRRRLEALSRLTIWLIPRDRYLDVMLPADFAEETSGITTKRRIFIGKIAKYLESLEIRTIV